MWIVRLALRRPYTFVVAAIIIVILGVLAVYRMPTDVFPEINIPVVSVIWSYSGISPEEMAEVVTIRSERSFTTTVNDIEHMESQSLPGLAVIKLFFHPNAKVEAAVAQQAAGSQSILRVLPQGIFPPAIIRYNASSVPILQLSVSSGSMSEQEVYDYGFQYIRTQMANVQGASFPLPYGGRPRQIMVDLNPDALYAQSLSANDVVTAINSQSLILPSGTVKIGAREFPVHLNSAPDVAEAFNRLPVKQAGGTTLYVGDVAHVRDGYAVQTNIVRHNGSRATLLTVLKNGGASTLQIVGKLKDLLPRIRSTLPKELDVRLLFDQSIFVRAAINSVVREAVSAALLTALMILLFLGSWRSTVIVCISIPLSILTSLAVLNLLNETVNVMTLGGMALAVGILVDDATVEIENIHRNLAQGKPIVAAILDGAQQIAVPAFVSTLCICIVFVPVIFLTGAAKYLFTPLALAVVLAMMTSYLLSRTLVPTMVKYLLAAELDRYREDHDRGAAGGTFWRAHYAFQARFDRMREGYRNVLAAALEHRRLVAVCFFLICAACVALYPFIGTDFFPQVDAGQIRLHVRASAGTRIEQTELYFAQVEEAIRKVIPKNELSDILDNIGLPYSGQNAAYSDAGTVGQFDGEILVSLNREHHSTWNYIRELRTRGTDGTKPARRRQQSADFTQLQLADRAEFLDQPEEQHRLPGCGADAAVLDEFDRSVDEHSGPCGRPDAAVAEQPGATAPRRDRVGGQSLQRAAALRCVRQRAGPRPWRGHARRGKNSRGISAETPRRQLLRNPRAGADNAEFISRVAVGAGVRHPAGVLRDGGEFPVVARSVHHPDGSAGSTVRHPADAVPDADHGERAVADGRDHEHRRGDRKQHPAGEFRERFPEGDRRGFGFGGARGRLHTPASGGDDRVGDDRRHAADGAGDG